MPWCLHALREDIHECELLVTYEFSDLVNLALGHIGAQKPILEDHCTVVNTEISVRWVLLLSLGLGYESQTAFLHNGPASASSVLELQMDRFITVSINHYF